ncbi:DUF5063 domain-containing protein [uncultured Microbulbifer sp.]|uniref:DUF5063 domain-containing protein n=1 Tax=uncultured Microbulbifer sp. TaxID=348147 RepID=UPI0026303BA8|nr:DUF5063 domain-containing protein [uncultured Microbulbifer sp.]
MSKHLKTKAPDLKTAIFLFFDPLILALVINMSIEQPIQHFLSFCLDERKEKVDLGNLIEELDRLVVATYLPEFEFDENEYPEPPDNEHLNIRETISERFPDLGFYCTVDCEPESIGDTNVVTGDAIDDLADIIGDLMNVQWYLENTTLSNAMWHFEFSYRTHWGFHLRELQRFLHIRWW